MLLATANVGRVGGPKNSFFEDPLWVFFVLFAAISAIAGAVFALLAAVRQHERALLVWPAIAFGLIVAFFWIGEAISPH